MDPLQGADIKLGRANDKLKEIAEIVAGVGKGYRFVEIVDPTIGAQVLRMELIPAPTELSIVVGEAIYQLRSILDHCVVQLSIYNTPGCNTRTPAFPFAESEADFRKEAKKRLAFLSPAAQKVVHGLKPHSNGGNRLLCGLNRLRNLDAHVDIVAIAQHPIVSNFSRVDPRGGIGAINAGWLAGALMVTAGDRALAGTAFDISKSGLPTDAAIRDLTEHLQYFVHLCFGATGVFDREPVVETLGKLYLEVEGVVAKFRATL